MKKQYNINTGKYEYYDNLTGSHIDGSLIEGGGFFDILSSIGSKLASESAKKVATAAVESGFKKVGEKMGDKAGEYVSEKLFSSKPPKPMGDIIKKELMKEEPITKEEEPMPTMPTIMRKSKYLEGASLSGTRVPFDERIKRLL